MLGAGAADLFGDVAQLHQAGVARRLGDEGADAGDPLQAAVLG